MRERVRVLSAVGLALLCPVVLCAETEMPRSVVSNGGGALEGAAYVISGSTVGQPAVGVMSGPANIHQAGFWYGGELLAAVIEEQALAVTAYELYPNYPNPFNPVTTFEFAVPARTRVSIRLYDVKGREMMRLLDHVMEAGRHEVILASDDLSSGVYFCRMVAGRFVKTRKLVLLK